MKNTSKSTDSSRARREHSDVVIPVKKTKQVLNHKDKSLHCSQSGFTSPPIISDSQETSPHNVSHKQVNLSSSTTTSHITSLPSSLPHKPVDSPSLSPISNSTVPVYSSSHEQLKNNQPLSSSSHPPMNESPSNANRKTTSNILKSLSEITDSCESDCFVQLIEKERLRTKDGKPYFKLTFRDRGSSAQVFLWSESVFYRECEKNWQLGAFFKIRGIIRESSYGPKLDLRRIREVVPQDKESGFDPRNCQPGSSLPPEEIVSELLLLAETHINKGPLLTLVRRIFKEYRLKLYELSASRIHHHCYPGGLLEHTLSVTKLTIVIYHHFSVEHPQIESCISKPILVAGAILHDIGKLLDSRMCLAGPQRTIAGNLIGHAILGLELINQFAAEVCLDASTKYQLEHLIISHSRFQDWGTPISPMTLEAMILHYADYTDSTFASSLKLLSEDVAPLDFTQKKGPFGVPLFKCSLPKSLSTIPSPSEDSSSL